MLNLLILKVCVMNDDFFNRVEPVMEDIYQSDWYSEAPSPLVPKRKVVRFKISNERDNSQS